jgi:hypothetical protein
LICINVIQQFARIVECGQYRGNELHCKVQSALRQRVADSLDQRIPEKRLFDYRNARRGGAVAGWIEDFQSLGTQKMTPEFSGPFSIKSLVADSILQMEHMAVVRGPPLVDPLALTREQVGTEILLRLFLRGSHTDHLLLVIFSSLQRQMSSNLRLDEDQSAIQ